MKDKILSNVHKGLLSVAIWAMSLSMTAQNISVRGTVTDEANLPIIGATVVVKGNTSHGTVTDAEGNYTINDVAPNARLVFSYIGMKVESVRVNNRKRIDVVLKEDAKLPLDINYRQE